MALLKGPANLGAGSITNAELGTGVVSPDKLSSVAQLFGFKNRIINGAMMIDQRNAGGKCYAYGVRYLCVRSLAHRF